MSTSRHQTVRDLLRSALPMGTRVIAGHKGLNRVVTWTSVLHTRPPAFPSLEGRELALLSIDALHLLNDKLTLVDIVNDLAQVEVAAIGVLGTIDARARAAAQPSAGHIAAPRRAGCGQSAGRSAAVARTARPGNLPAAFAVEHRKPGH